MFVKKLLLEHFRIHTSLLLECTNKTTIVVGANASGKTSLMEALSLLATGDSFRAEKIEEMVAFGKELGRVTALIDTHEDSEPEDTAEQMQLEVMVTRGVVQGRKTPYRLFSVNEVRRQKRVFVGRLKVVSFRPEDMRLVEGSPSRRRSFIDMPLSLLYPEYEQSLTTYENTLKRRNKLLEAVREREQPPTVLQYWNLAALKHGSIVQKYRQSFFSFFKTVSFPYPFSVQYCPSLITEDRQAEYASREIASGHSLIGPHKDDFSVFMENMNSPDGTVDVASYGSRGQQRLAVLWLKTAELAYISHSSHELPVLLLDDIFSELDADSRMLVLSLLGKTQAIVTTTEESSARLLVNHLGLETVTEVHLR